jgi:hypothetical protein
MSASLAHPSIDVVNKAAAILGKYVPGEALGATEYSTIDSCIDNVIEEIAKIVVIADREEIPNVLFETFSRLVAIYAAAAFSNQPVSLDAIRDHEQRLRYLIAQTPTYEVLRSNYF